MNNLDFLDLRRSVPSRLLGEPGPSSDQVRRILQSAVRVPDHGRLTPWRFIELSGDGRSAFGKLLLQRFNELHPVASEGVIDKESQRFSHAPLVIVVVAKLITDHKVPVQEQLLSGGALCFALLQAAQAVGFSAQWLTGWAAYDEHLCTQLGLEESERVLGFIHIGTSKDMPPERQRPDPTELLSVWSP